MARVSPWLWGPRTSSTGPHLIIGLLEIGTALTTQTVPDYRRRDDHVGVR